MTDRLVGIATDDEGVLDACSAALEDLATTERVGTGADELAQPLEYDALLLDLGITVRDGVALLAQCRLENIELPVLLLGREVEADLAVELVKLGAADFLSVPFEPEVLARKVERLRNRDSGPTVRLNTLEPFQIVDPPAENSRRSFRASVPATSQVRARLPVEGGYVVAMIVDLSLEADGWPGGILLRFREDAVGARKLAAAEVGTTRLFQISGPAFGAPIDVAGRVVRVRRAAGGAEYELALQYRPVRPENAAAIHRFWLDCQAGERGEHVRRCLDSVE